MSPEDPKAYTGIKQKIVKEGLKNVLENVTLDEFLTDKIITVKINTPFGEVPEIFDIHHIRHLPVVDNDNKLVGLLTKRDLFQIRSPRKLMDGSWHYDKQMLNGVILKHVMKKDLVTLSPDKTIGEALMDFVHTKIGCILVVDKERRLKGIMTRHDILHLMADFYQS